MHNVRGTCFVWRSLFMFILMIPFDGAGDKHLHHKYSAYVNRIPFVLVIIKGIQNGKRD